MKKIGLIGFGDFGRQIELHLLDTASSSIRFYYFDDYTKANNSFPFSSFLDPQFKDLEFIVCLGYKQLPKKKEIIALLKHNNCRILSYIHPSAYVSKYAKLGEGVIIYPQCNIDMNVAIEDGVALNNSVVVSHDTVIGNSCFLAPGVCINGNVRIGACTFIGSNSSISNGVQLGERNIVGIGSVITRSTADDVSSIGNPAREVKAIKLG